MTIGQQTTRFPSATSVLCYAFGGIAATLKTAFFGLFTLFYYSTVRGVPGSWVGLVSAIGLLWDALIDPLFGTLSDRSKHPLGKRHVYMMGSLLLLGVSIWLYFAPPASLPVIGLFGWLFVTTFLVRVAVSAFDVPYMALGGEVSPDYQRRTAIFGVRAAVSLLGAVATIALVFAVFFPEIEPGVDPKMNAAAYPRMGAALGGIMTLSAVIAILGTLSWRRAPSAVSAPAPSVSRASVMAVPLRCLRVQSVRVAMTSFALFALAVVLNRSLSLHFLTYCAQITESRWITGMETAFYVGALCGVPTWIVSARFLEKKTIYLVGSVVTALLLALATTAVGEGRWLEPGQPVPLLVGHGIGGFFSSVLWFIPHSMLADVADDVELQTGNRIEGAVYGLFSFCFQIAGGLAAILAGFLMDHFAGVVPGQAEQTAEAAARIAVIYGVLPAGILFLACLVGLRYRLTRNRLRAVQDQLEGGGRP